MSSFGSFFRQIIPSLVAKTYGTTSAVALLGLMTVSLLGVEQFTVTTVAGKPARGYANGAKNQALFNQPGGIATSSSGITYIADTDNQVIRKIAADGTVTTLAGSPGVAGLVDGIGTAARFDSPSRIAIHPTTGHLFVTENGGNAILEINPGNGAVTTFAGKRDAGGAVDGLLSDARFYGVGGLCFAASGLLFVADFGNHAIRKIDAGIVSTLAGTLTSYGYVDDTGAAARFYYPLDVTIGGDGNLYVADNSNFRIRKIVPGTGAVTTLVGDGTSAHTNGTGTASSFEAPFRIFAFADDLYVIDGGTNLRKIAMPGAEVSDFFSSSYWLNGMANSSTGTLLVTEQGPSLVVELDGAGSPTPFAGVSDSEGNVDGDKATARFAHPNGIAAGPNGSLYVADSYNHSIRKITSAGNVTTIAGSAGSVSQIDGNGSAAGFDYPGGMVVDRTGNLFVTDRNTIRRITPTGAVATVAGLASTPGFINGNGSTARFGRIFSLAIDGDGNLYVADNDYHSIRKITSTGDVTTLVGDPARTTNVDGNAMIAGFQSISGIACDSTGNIFIADDSRHVVRRVTPTGDVTTIAGQQGVVGQVDEIGANARFTSPTRLYCDGVGTLFVIDANNTVLRRITANTWEVTTIAGSPFLHGQVDGIGSAARFYASSFLTGNGGSLYITDSINNTIRKATPPAGTVVVTPGGSGSSDGGGGGGCGVGSLAAFLLIGLAAFLNLRRQTFG